ncbi:MAG TPA: cell division protein ZapA [bacterium]|jgi:cell division protein ZapA (FtsZ GTPase activity inhibitor)|nr:cell division protein ZapA [bacterium]
MTDKDRNATDISIFGHKFTLKGPSDPDYMRELAAKVDERMKELSRPKPGEPIHRVAILTALVLMDELTKARRSLDGERQRFEQASRSAAHLDLKLQTMLNDALQAEHSEAGLHMEEQPEVLDLEGMGRRDEDSPGE